MAARGKAKEYQIQVEIESQEDWEEQISKEGLLVVDVYQDWCGPCKAMVPIFKRIKNETGDELLRFAMAKADLVDALERYRGRSEPNFLFYAGGVLVEAIRGANAPGINKAIVDQLAIEHGVLETGGNRIEIVDKVFPGVTSRMEAQEGVSESDASEVDEEDDLSTDEDEEEARRKDHMTMDFGGEQVMLDCQRAMKREEEDNAEEVLIDKEYAVLVIMPSLNNDKTKQTIVNKMKSAGFDILQELEHEISNDEAPQVAKQITNPEVFDEMLTHLSVGTSYIYVISKGELGKNVIAEIKEFVGPENYFIAKDVAPMSLRAMLGNNEVPLCGLITSDSVDDSRRSLQTFFPNFITQKLSATHLRPPKEFTTVGVVLPELYENLPGNFLATLQQLGYKILHKKEVTLTVEQATKMFKEQNTELFYDELMENAQSGPSLALLLTNGQNSIVTDWLDSLGPFVEGGARGSLRAKFLIPGTTLIQLHGSLNENLAERETRWFFPMEQVLLLVKPVAFNLKDHIMSVLREEGFLVAGRKMYTLSPDQVRVLYSMYKSNRIIDPLINELTKSASCFVILSRNSAIDRLKELLGYLSNPGDLPADFDDEDEEEEVLNDQSSVTTDGSRLVDTELIEQMRNIYLSSGMVTPIITYLPDQFKNLLTIFGHLMPDKGIHISEDVEQAAMDIEQIFGGVRFDRDGYMKKKKRMRLKICDTKKVQMMSKEEVFEEVAKMPPPVKEEEKVDAAAEEKLKRLNEEKLLAQMKEREKDEAKAIYDAKFIDPADLFKWGAIIEYPPPDKACLDIEGEFTFGFDEPTNVDQADRASMRDPSQLKAEYEAQLLAEEEEEVGQTSIVIENDQEQTPAVLNPDFLADIPIKNQDVISVKTTKSKTTTKSKVLSIKTSPSVSPKSSTKTGQSVDKKSKTSGSTGRARSTKSSKK